MIISGWSTGGPGQARPEIKQDGSPVSPGCQLPASLAGLAANLPSKAGVPSLWTARLHEPAKAFGVPTKIPQVRLPGRPHEIPTDTTTFRGTPWYSC